MQNKILFAAVVFLFATTSALAAPTLVSADDQSFDQYENIQQARDITITDDSTTPQITASGDIRIHIPTSFPMIWDDRVASVNLSGTAVDAGRFTNGTTAVTYEDSDKTAVIQVAENFAAGESVKIAGLFFEGFYWADANARLELVIVQGGSAVAIDSKSIQVWTGTNEDGSEPEAPSDIQLTQISTSSVKLTWTDPPDMDASQIKILRGVAPLPVSGTAFAEEGRGVQQFTDSSLKIGDTVSYILRASDGRNLSVLSEEVLLTLVENIEPEPVACTADYTPVCGSDGVTYANLCNAEAAGITTSTVGECVVENDVIPPVLQPPLTSDEEKASEAGITLTQLQNAISKYSDLAVAHWSSGFLARLNSDKILDGYSDGTIQPDTTINRAELAKIAANSFALDSSLITNFSDVPADAWFASFVGALQKVGAVWTASTEFHPADGVARGEAVWTILTAAGVEIPAATVKPFPDVSLSHPYASAIAWAAENGILSGYDDGTFGLRDTLTRAQVAKIVVLLKNNLAQ
jgi:hypothetical protein